MYVVRDECEALELFELLLLPDRVDDFERLRLVPFGAQSITTCIGEMLNCLYVSTGGGVIGGVLNRSKLGICLGVSDPVDLISDVCSSISKAAFFL